ncbi:hypothetical protein M0805_003813 [Coniferiporia weirii]|nr:hypothetical protein M0805_003813 [Coniferiporia weirii]
MHETSLLCYAVLFAGLLQFVKGQQVAFNWTGQTVSDAGPSECESIPINVLPLTTNSTLDAVSPFYMLSFELGGIGMSDFLGTDPSNLTWLVRHPQGTTILLYVVDSKGNMGALGESTVQSGNTTNCHPTQQSSPIKVTTDISQVATCDKLTASIIGGVKPYTVTTISINSTTNYTLNANDDQFTYVDRASPGDGFIIAASDSTGQWAIGTSLISSIGSTDTSCPGEQSFGSQSNSTSPDASPNLSTSGSSNKGPIIGGVIAGVVVICASIGLALYFYFRRRKDLSATNRRAIFDEDDVSPYVLQTDLQMRHTYAASTAVTDHGSDYPLLRDPHRPMRVPTALTVGGISSTSGSIYGGEINSGGAPANYFPSRSSSPEQMVSGNMVPPMTAKQRLAQEMAREQEKRSVVVQHEDAEDLVDLPPVYRERNVASGSSSS